MRINFNNTYNLLPKEFYEIVNPEIPSNPTLIKFNQSLAKELDMDLKDLSDEDLTTFFSGQKLFPGSLPIAMAYAGMQFGHTVPQLGDGRAHLLGEVAGNDIQLKGSGRTSFSRRGDGKSALGPVLREYIVSEAMHFLNVPTTRALCAVTTGEEVFRQFGPEPGGILTRVAKSHIRVGTFQYFAFQGDIENIKVILDYSIKRHYPEISIKESYSKKVLDFLKALVVKQGDLISKWMSLGFIHGVMNTDNFSIAGITIDYGPCAFMDVFKNDKVFSSIDQNGRYAYSNQISIAKWNILRLAECLLPLLSSNENEAIKIIETELIPEFDYFDKAHNERMAKKLGLNYYLESDAEIINLFLNYLEKEKLDFTLSFRNLPLLFNDQTNFYPQSQLLERFKILWKSRVKSDSINNLNNLNPLYIPRNHKIQEVIDKAYEGNFELFHKMNKILKNPFNENSEARAWEQPPTPNEVVKETFCGT